MKQIEVNASRRYPVIIGSGILPRITELLPNGARVCIVSDSQVWPLYGESLAALLCRQNILFEYFTFPAGESSKNAETYLSLLNFLAENHFTRTDCIIALGGGVVGDLAGFAAATFLRGIPYIQVPTTLLAAVDSSVGGKTAIDLDAGKNLAGAFCQPRLVLCDTDTLDTLPEHIFRDGCAEVIKYGVLYDPALFDHLTDKGLAFERENVIARCVELKRDVVMEDEFDTGARMKLNLGHTIGHGVEAQSHFEISHGKAVAIGMAIVATAAVKNSICSPETAERIISTINTFGLPTQTQFDADSLFHSALSDKKRSGGTVNLIVPVEIGNCLIYPMNVTNLKSFIEAGL